jgi:hypothetical protein
LSEVYAVLKAYAEVAEYGEREVQVEGLVQVQVEEPAQAYEVVEDQEQGPDLQDLQIILWCSFLSNFNI